MQHEFRAEQIFSVLLNEATLFHLHTIQIPRIRLFIISSMRSRSSIITIVMRDTCHILHHILSQSFNQGQMSFIHPRTPCHTTSTQAQESSIIICILDRDDKYGIVFHAGHETRFLSFSYHTRVIYDVIFQQGKRSKTHKFDIAFCHEILG